VNKAIFLDRDGVINRGAPEGEYITRWKEMQILPAVPEAIRLLNQNGFLVVVVTNQRCVARGLVTTESLEALHRMMCEVLAAAGARIDDVYYCPHGLESACNCRKPEPGMLLEAAREYKIALPLSWMIGDSKSDMKAGRKAGCKTACVTKYYSLSAVSGDVIAPSLYDAVRKILNHDSSPGQA
jgi:D-glycero-D-manno-heptose 1,7-bisphosphate phosphatase